MSWEQLQAEINLGDLVRDRISGMEGIVVCVSVWLNGCLRITIQPKETNDGVCAENRTFDIEQMTVLEAGALCVRPKVAEAPQSAGVGGPAIEPVQHEAPQR